MIKFTQHHIDAFQRISHDANPLHVDADYAGRTSFNRIVVYGVAGVFACLGLWAKGRAFQLKKLKAEFKKPLFLDELYEVAIEEKGSHVTLRILSEYVVLLKLSYDFEYCESPVDSSIGVFQPRAEANRDKKLIPDAVMAEQQGYTFNRIAENDFRSWFSVSTQIMPANQFMFLLWASYLVGMVLPGEAALFTNLNVDFEAGIFPASIQLKKFEAHSFDSVYKGVNLSGRAHGVSEFQFRAFYRRDS